MTTPLPLPQIADYEMVRQLARDKFSEAGAAAGEALEAKVLEMYPDRDWDEEELDEMADEPPELVQIFLLAWELLLPPRRLFWRVCCAVRRVKMERAADKKDGAEVEEEEEEEDDTMIEGFPIDCGTKDRKFLSMAKAKAVTIGRHPHKSNTDPDDGELYIEVSARVVE
jgi:hypothetical protein